MGLQGTGLFAEALLLVMRSAGKFLSMRCKMQATHMATMWALLQNDTLPYCISMQHQILTSFMMLACMGKTLQECHHRDTSQTDCSLGLLTFGAGK